MAMKKSIGRTLAHIDVAANTSVRIHEDFFNTHRDYHHLSQNATEAGASRGYLLPAMVSNSEACCKRSAPTVNTCGIFPTMWYLKSRLAALDIFTNTASSH